MRRQLTAAGWWLIALAFVLSWFTLPYYFGPFVDRYGFGGLCATAVPNVLLIVAIVLIYNREPGAARLLAWVGWRWHDWRARKRC